MMSCSKAVSRLSEVVAAHDCTYLMLIWLVAIFPDLKVWLEVGEAAGFEELAQIAHISRAFLESACNAPWQR
jgi:hypothetical protein